jgi:ppGpp synthetase/RelA/SpoT-type nucleotidyltranferase
MAEVVYEKCLEIISQKLTVRATVQRRAKNPKSFAEKIKKPKYCDKYESVDEVFSYISDLAGVRIATYLESDREIVVDEIKKEFVGLNNSEPCIDSKNKNEHGYHYRATHCQVYLCDEDLAGANENLRGTTCEIQVCSLLAHVFNEIEHDLRYKPLSGELSSVEREYIDQLGLLTKAGDITIKRLLHETDARLKQKTGEFSDVFDFVARMREELGLGEVFSANAGQLFDELRSLGLKTPEAITQKVCSSSNKPLGKICEEEYLKFKTFLDTTQQDLLEDGSSDVLLAGVLSVLANQIIANHPMGRGMGRPLRLVQIANAYRRMVTNS